MEETKKDNKILSFERDAEFFFAKFEREIDSGKYLEALASIRAALEKEPEDGEYRISLAELYTEMGRYVDSNVILFQLHQDGFDFDGDVLYGIACNYVGLEDVEPAQAFFRRYIDEFPDAEYIPEALDFLDMLEYEEQNARADGGVFGDETLEMIEKSRTLLDTGYFDESVELLEALSQQKPEAIFVRNNLALAYYCMGDMEKGLVQAERALALDPENVHAQCNRMLLLHAKHACDEEMCIRTLKRIQTEKPDEIMRIAITMCEFGYHAEGNDVLKKLLVDMPYDVKTLFLIAVSAANSGNLLEAKRCFTDILRIEPENSIALYYANAVKKALDAGRDIQIDYSYQVPMEEARRRMAYLSAAATEGKKHVFHLWKSDPQFVDTVKWGLTLHDEEIKHVLIDMIGAFADSRAEQILREYLLLPDEPDEMKDSVVEMLSMMEAEEPYYAMMSGRFLPVRIEMEEQSRDMLSESAKKVLDRILELGSRLMKREVVDYANLLIRIYAFNQGSPMRIHKIDDWAAAFLVYASTFCNKLNNADRQYLNELNGSVAVRRLVKKINGRMSVVDD